MLLCCLYLDHQGQLPAALCRNALWRRDPQLTVQEGMDLGHQSTVCLLHHLFITLLEIPEEKTLIEPLNRLAQQPADMQVCSTLHHHQHFI